MDRSDLSRNSYMLTGALARKGYDWWWHSFTGHHAETGEPRAFFVEYFVINPAVSPDVVSFGQPPVNGIPSYLMVKAGSWGPGEQKKQLHAFYPAGSATIDPGILNLSVGDNRLTETRASGAVVRTPEEVAEHPEYMSDSGSMSWDLTIDKRIALNVGYGAGGLARRLNAFTMFWHAEGMKTLYSGTVEIDGEKYVVTPETSYGYADKNWGTDFTNPWLWLASSNLTRRSTGEKLHHSALDIGGGNPEVLGVPLGEKLLVGLNLEGVDYDVNFSNPLTGSRTFFRVTETDDDIVWRIQAQTHRFALAVDARCSKEEMLMVRYESPAGLKEHTRLWNAGREPGGCACTRDAAASGPSSTTWTWRISGANTGSMPANTPASVIGRARSIIEAPTRRSVCLSPSTRISGFVQTRAMRSSSTIPFSVAS
jgi:hypothetical protein